MAYTPQPYPTTPQTLWDCGDAGGGGGMSKALDQNRKYERRASVEQADANVMYLRVMIMVRKTKLLKHIYLRDPLAQCWRRNISVTPREYKGPVIHYTPFKIA
jgi:hypothetical protein